MKQITAVIKPFKLEEVREAGLPFLDLVAAARAHDGVVGDDAGTLHRHENRREPVGQRVLLVRVGEHARRWRGDGARRRDQHSGEGEKKGTHNESRTNAPS